MTRGGVYDEILPEPEGNPEGGALMALYEKILQSHGVNIETAIFQYSILR